MSLKSIIFLVFLFGIAQDANAQGKPEFGFVAGIGNFMLPSEKPVANYSFSSPFNLKTHYEPGLSYSLGFWHSIRINRHFRFSMELIYRHQRSKIMHDVTRAPESGSGIAPFTTNFTFQQNGLALPLKFQLFFKKAGKFSLEFGAGFSHLFAATYNRNTLQFFPGFITEKQIHNARPTHWEDFNYQLFYPIELHFRIHTKTSIGLGFTFEKAAEFKTYSLSDNLHTQLSQCLCLEKSSGFRPNMQSFSVSLRHNILQ